MSAMQALITWLLANGTITATLASASAIHPIFLPRNHPGFPALSVEQTGTDEIALLDGGVNELRTATIRITVWSRTVLEAANISQVLDSELNGFRGQMGTRTCELARKVGEYSVGYEDSTELYRYANEYDIAYH